METKRPRHILVWEINSLEVGIDNIDGDILDLVVEKEGKRKEIEKLKKE